MTENEMETRINQINEEFALLPQMEDYDLTLEAIGEEGDVKVTLRKGQITFEKTFGITDDLDTICDTFGYPETISPRSKDIALNGLEMACFNESNDLVVIRKGTTEKFKVREHHREEVIAILREKLGKKFKP